MKTEKITQKYKTNHREKKQEILQLPLQQVKTGKLFLHTEKCICPNFRLYFVLIVKKCVCQNWNRVLLSLRLSLHSPVSPPPQQVKQEKLKRKLGKKYFRSILQVDVLLSAKPTNSHHAEGRLYQIGGISGDSSNALFWAVFGQFFPFQLFERRTKGAFYLVSLTQGVSLIITTITLWWYFQRM